MTIRRLNYTRRIELQEKHIQVSIGARGTNGALTFSVSLNLPDGLPADAALSLEAYSASPPARQRFALGSVGCPRLPDGADALLRDLPTEATKPLFRFKVIDTSRTPGRILASANQLRPVDSEGQADHRKGLLHIAHQDLDGPIWELEIDNPGFEPTLWIDSYADPDREFSQDPKFIALVYPEVFYRVLTFLIIDDEMRTIDDEAEWGHAWFQIANGLPAMANDDLPRADAQHEERRQWIESATRSFAKQFDLRELIRPRTEESV